MTQYHCCLEIVSKLLYVVMNQDKMPGLNNSVSLVPCGGNICHWFKAAGTNQTSDVFQV